MRKSDLSVRFATWFAIFAVGFALATFIATNARPHCPTEDSCSIDYRDGRWFIDGREVSR